MKNISKLYMGLLMGLGVSHAAFAALPVAASCGVAALSFDAPTIPHCGEKIKALAALAGPDWRAVAEKNRKPELKHLTKAKIIALMRKYADKETGDVGGEPLDEMPEIAEATFLAGDFCHPYGIALWRHFFENNAPVRDKVTAAKLLNGFERTFAGVIPHDGTGEKVEFSPRWLLTHFKYGKYSAPLPGGGYFKSSWTNDCYHFVMDIQTSAKTLDCHVMPALFSAFSAAKVNGRKIDFGHSGRGCNFTVDVEGKNDIQIELSHASRWPKKK